MKKRITFIPAFVLIFSLAGCSEKPDPNRLVTAYFGDSVTSADITHHIGGKTVQWTAAEEDTDILRDWASKLKYKLLEFEEGQSPGDCDGGEVYDFSFTEEGGGFSYVINGPDSCYLLIDGHWFSVKNPSPLPIAEPQKEQLTLADDRQLAKKGSALSWDDFEQYEYEDTGSGLLIYLYDIDEKYCLIIGGSNTASPPMYIRLVRKSEDSEFIDDGVYIDIRSESVDDFTNGRKKQNRQTK